MKYLIIFFFVCFCSQLSICQITDSTGKKVNPIDITMSDAVAATASRGFSNADFTQFSKFIDGEFTENEISKFDSLALQYGKGIDTILRHCGIGEDLYLKGFRCFTFESPDLKKRIQLFVETYNGGEKKGWRIKSYRFIEKDFFPVPEDTERYDSNGKKLPPIPPPMGLPIPKRE